MRKHTHRGYHENPAPKESTGLDISGKKDMLYVRSVWQEKLNKVFYDIRNKIWAIEKKKAEIIQSKNYAEKLKSDIEKHMDEKDRALSIIENLLKKEIEYENEMLGKTLDGMKSQGDVTVKQRLKDVEIDTVQLGSVEQYKRLYPKFGEEILKNKKEMELKDKEIRIAQEKFSGSVSNYNTILENIKGEIQKARDNFETYNDILEKAESELKSCRFHNSMLYRISSKKTKMLLNLDTTIHDIRKFKNALEIVSNSISQLIPMTV